MRLSRRSLLRTIVLSAGLLAFSPATGIVRAETLPRSARVQLGGILTTAPEATGTGPSGLQVIGQSALAVASDGLFGSYVSPEIETRFPFNAIGAIWDFEGDPDRQLYLSVRTASAGEPWSNWIQLPPIDHGPDTSARAGSELALVAGDRLQFRVTLVANGQAPVLRNLDIVYIDSMHGPQLERLEPLLRTQTSGKPWVISRAEWGCPQPYNSPSWPPRKEPVRKVFVHHTVTTNGLNPMPVVRAIWDYHTRTLGWGDIGYNYLVDQFGNIYEGRYGGDDVVAAHAKQFNPGSCGIALLGQFQEGQAPAVGKPTNDAINGLVAMTTWQCSRRSIAPTGWGTLAGVNLPNICGHRDGLTTQCPGTHLYSLLDLIRSRVANGYDPQASVPKYRCDWIGHTCPPTMGPGEIVNLHVTVKNTGWFAWPQGGPGSVRLGYHWHRPDGSHYWQPDELDKRSYLPYDGVTYDEVVTINAQAATPTELGTYTLKWDLVHEGYTWFADFGASQPLPLAVNIQPPVLALGQNHLVLMARPNAESGRVPVMIWNAGEGSFDYRVSTSQTPHWLRVDPAAGVSPASVRVWADAAGLGNGTYEGQIDVIGQSIVAVANSPAILRVTLIVTDQLQPRVFIPGVRR